MSFYRKVIWIYLVVLAVGIKIVSYFPRVVERWYSNGLYPQISRAQRVLFGWVPFSVGDILYLSAGVWLLYGLTVFIKKLARRQADKAWLLLCLRRFVFVFLLVYVLFNGLWGLNYNRLDIADQLQLEVHPYSTAELTRLLQGISDRLAVMDSVRLVDRGSFRHHSALFDRAIDAYRRRGVENPHFSYTYPSIKASLFSYLGDYIGFLGYYNPFTGEAQVNTTVPVFTQPFTACHEIAHQMGYAKENEANLMGYLTIRGWGGVSPAFEYSADFEIYMYAARELYARDSTLYKPFRAQQRPGFKQDVRELQAFNRRYTNPIEPFIWKAYGGYLRANRQPQGIRTYSEVLAWLIAYENKYGWNFN
jgi:Protein of unknown function (DUF3810)